MHAIVNGAAVILPPSAWLPAIFSAALQSLGVSASLPATEPAGILDFGNGVRILPVTDMPPAYNSDTQQLVVGAPVISGDTVQTSYTVAALPAQQIAAILFAKAVKAGVVLTSSGTPALNGTYAIDQATLFNLNSEILSIETNTTFTNKLATKDWPDSSSVRHTFTVPQFKAFGTEVAAYIDALIVAEQAAAAGQAASWPSNALTIA